MVKSFWIAAFSLACSSAAFSSQAARAVDACDYVLGASKFEPTRHGNLLATYMNWAPSGHGVGDQADRDDDRIGVCRIFEDGSVITSFGCAGADSVSHEVISTEETFNRLDGLLFKSLTEVAKEPAFSETIIETGDTSVYAAPDDAGAAPGDATWRVDNASPLSLLVHKLCPLDNEPDHRKLVARGEHKTWVQTPWCAKGSFDCPQGWSCSKVRVPTDVLAFRTAPNDPTHSGWDGPACGKGGSDDEFCPRYCRKN